MYIGLIQSTSSEITAFYFKPNSERLAYDKQAVRINKLNGILPSMCKEAGFQPKSSHCLRVLCPSTLFNTGVFKYEKVSEMKSTEVSDILAPKCSSTSNVSVRKEVSETAVHVEVGGSASTCEFMSCPYFNNCTISINVNGVAKNE